MADDWVSNYKNSRGHQKAKEATNEKLLDMASDRAVSTFRELSERIKGDVGSYTGDGFAQGLTYVFVPAKQFIVRKPEFPSVTLDVMLEGVTIECRYGFKPDDTSEKKSKIARFRLCVDLLGNIYVKRNGDVYTDASEISEAILRPVFDFLD
jgi:hypothetical protein